MPIRIGIAGFGIREWSAGTYEPGVIWRALSGHEAFPQESWCRLQFRTPLESPVLKPGGL